MASWDHDDLKDSRYKTVDDKMTTGNFEVEDPPEEYIRHVKHNHTPGCVSAKIFDGSTAKPIEYKYGEDISMKEIQRYLDGTYKGHYATRDEDIQAIDAIFSLGNADTTCRDLIIKYAWRLGKKEGYQKDLMKIIHYAIFALHHCRENGLK